MVAGIANHFPVATTGEFRGTLVERTTRAGVAHPGDCAANSEYTVAGPQGNERTNAPTH
jgi:hypothetical protein